MSDLARFYCPELRVGDVSLSAEESAHAATSLRLRAADACELFDGRGHSAPATVIDPGAGSKRDRTVRCRVERIASSPRPSQLLTLIVPGCKGDRLEWLVEKCTELGVDRIVLTNHSRSVVRVEEKHAARLSRAALEATKQCGRAWLPEISVSPEPPPPSAELWVAHPAENAPPITTLLQALPPSRDLTVLVGPEGGFTDQEIERFHKEGAKLVGLASHILRVETAAVAIAAVWSANHLSNGK